MLDQLGFGRRDGSRYYGAVDNRERSVLSLEPRVNVRQFMTLIIEEIQINDDPIEHAYRGQAFLLSDQRILRGRGNSCPRNLLALNGSMLAIELRKCRIQLRIHAVEFSGHFREVLLSPARSDVEQFELIRGNAGQVRIDRASQRPRRLDPFLIYRCNGNEPGAITSTASVMIVSTPHFASSDTRAASLTVHVATRNPEPRMSATIS